MKGNGNSRYLKTVGEALSLYPTYEDFLQAMIAGTFPVDFNGINKDGWTQQGTLLNKANLLSDTVISTLGLSTGANSTPNDAFNVLANIGNVHVWRKTVVAEEEVPAGYTLGPVQNSNIDIFGGYSNDNVTKRGVWRYSKTISVDANGTISLDNYSLLDVESTWSGNNNDAYVAKQCLSGSFAICIDAPTGWDSENIHPLYPPIVGKVYFFPDDIEVLDIERPDTSGYLEVAANKYQEVTSNPYVPAGTHITYLTSVNRNAYQEGDDAKEAGYVLGEVVTGKTAISMTYNRCRITYCSAIEVNNNGTISPAPNSGGMNIPTNNMDSDDLSALKGKFFHTEGSENDSDQIGFFSDPNYWAYIPEDAVITMETHPVGSPAIYITKYQPVTGYPAIPAGTTIEYLGVLGDKIRMQIVSYIGTGTSGEATPCSITADFEFKTAEFLGFLRGASFNPSIKNNDSRDAVLSEAITTSFTAYSGFCLGDAQYTHGKKSGDGKTITWYNTYNNKAYQQLNESGSKYFFRFFG